MGKCLLAKAHIANLNELTELEVTELTSSTVNATALAILKRQGSRGITIVSSHRKFIFDIHVDPDWQKWQTKSSKLAAKDFEGSEFHQDTCHRYLILGFVLSHISWKTISNPKLWWSYKALQSNFVLPSATTLSNICWREYTLTVDAINKQWPSQNIGSVALDGWTSMNELAITLVIAYCIERHWALREVTLAFNEIDRPFISTFEILLQIIGRGPIHWSKASRTFVGCTWSFWTYRQPFVWNYYT